MVSGRLGRWVVVESGYEQGVVNWFGWSECL